MIHFEELFQSKYHKVHKAQLDPDLDFDMSGYMPFLEVAEQFIHYMLYRKIIYDLERYKAFDR